MHDAVTQSIYSLALFAEAGRRLASAGNFERRELSFDCSLVLYDVTTLYFESFKEDEEENALRKTGFSKDQKPQQP
ncbi:MAG: hypothetical protein HGA86_08045, partial [Anaerolineaceae bacterium]|nr:hypothetical protein [Anaerolineaceae bacterium]